MEKKFNKKPITISSSGSDDEICAFHIDQDGRSICDVWVYSDQDEPVESAKATAHLFASSPKLYEALENNLYWLKRMEQLRWEDPTYAPIFKKQIAESESILAQARGENMNGEG